MRPEMPNIRLSRRGKIAIGVIVSLIILISLLGALARVYANYLWFGEVGYRRVFSSILITRVILFLIAGAGVAAVIGANVWLAYRLRPPFRPMSQEQENLERYRVAVEPRKRLAFGAIVLVTFLFAGSSAQSSWKTWQLWRYGQSFGQTDPQFHRDISFFAWDYPAYRLLLSYAFSAVIFSLLLGVGVHYLFGALRVITPGPKLTISARRHITVLVFLFVLLKACAYWLDRYGLMFSDRGKVTGASYTDVNASLPALTILFWVALLIAAAVLASLWLKSAQVPTISFVVLLVLSIGINGVYPFFVQQFTVKPNASDKEKAYISRNIAATRQAYDIVTNDATGSGAANGNVTYSAYANGVQADPSTLPLDAATVPNIRVTDPNVVSPAFTSAQKLRNYYGFADKLDIDRYTVDGLTSDYVVGVRELKAANLTDAQTNWINQHTVYTHGYGFVAAKANKDANTVGDFSAGNIPQTGFLHVDQPQIYYGELGVDYSIVGATGARENDGADQRDSYTGSGGVPLGNIFNRLAFALKYRQSNFILNDAVSAKGAKIIFDRDPRQRVLKVAPFLQVDGDPYPAVVDGKILWILDGYTTMANYPYSERQSLANLTTDSLSAAAKTASQPDNQINYIRNSVKATVDAYTGQVKLYAWDESDPVLKTWRKVFPGAVADKADIPAGVLDHIRYPQDLFEVQRGLLQKYHVTDPVVFYNGSDQWTVPDDPTAQGNVDQPPYYVLAGSNAGTGPAQYQLTSPMKVNNLPNMAAYISVNSQSGPGYGRFSVLQLPSSTSIQGPQQIYSRFNSEPTISSNLSLLRTGGSEIIEGNLLTLPIGGTFLYVEPLYVQGTGANSLPLLRRVLVAYGPNQKIGYGVDLTSAIHNLSQAIVGQDILAGAAGGGSTTPPSSSAPATSAPTSAPRSSAPPGGGAGGGTTALLSQIDAALNRLETAYRAGDFAAIGQAQADVKSLTEQYLRAQGGPGSATASPTGS